LEYSERLHHWQKRLEGLHSLPLLLQQRLATPLELGLGEDGVYGRGTRVKAKSCELDRGEGSCSRGIIVEGEGEEVGEGVHARRMSKGSSEREVEEMSEQWYRVEIQWEFFLLAQL
jgi:hypothetical protein